MPKRFWVVRMQLKACRKSPRWSRPSGLAAPPVHGAEFTQRNDDGLSLSQGSLTYKPSQIVETLEKPCHLDIATEFVGRNLVVSINPPQGGFCGGKDNSLVMSNPAFKSHISTTASLKDQKRILTPAPCIKIAHKLLGESFGDIEDRGVFYFIELPNPLSAGAATRGLEPM